VKTFQNLEEDLPDKILTSHLPDLSHPEMLDSFFERSVNNLSVLNFDESLKLDFSHVSEKANCY
jgi:hypothetical protein